VNESARHSQHALSADEVPWGIPLIAVIMAIHAVGIPTTLAVSDRLWRRRPPRPGFHTGVPVLTLASWSISLVHLVEVIIWSGFLLWGGAMTSAADGAAAAKAGVSSSSRDGSRDG